MGRCSISQSIRRCRRLRGLRLLPDVMLPAHETSCKGMETPDCGSVVPKPSDLPPQPQDFFGNTARISARTARFFAKPQFLPRSPRSFRRTPPVVLFFAPLRRSLDFLRELQVLLQKLQVSIPRLMKFCVSRASSRFFLLSSRISPSQIFVEPRDPIQNRTRNTFLFPIGLATNVADFPAIDVA